MLSLLYAAREQIKTETSPTQGGLIARAIASTMSFDNGLTNSQTYAHAGLFCCEEAIEKMGEMFRINTRAAVFNAAAHRLRVREHSSDRDSAVRGLVPRLWLHRIDGQIDDYLL